MTAEPLIWHSRPSLGVEEEQAAARVIRSGMLIGGQETRRFAATLGARFPGADVVLASSGRSALIGALKSLGLPAGSGVVVPTYVCDAVIWAISAAGLRPVLCDVGPAWLVMPETVAAALQPGCGAILLPPPFGIVQSAAPFRQFGLPIIADICQANPLVDLSPDDAGDIVVMSFHPTKFITAGGGGAAISGRDRYGAALLDRQAADWEAAPFTEFQAAMGLEQLAKIDQFTAHRRRLYERYSKAIAPELLAPIEAARGSEAGHLLRMPIRLRQGTAAGHFARFADRGILARHGVDNLAHRRTGLDDALFPNAVQALDDTLSVPFYPALDDAAAFRVAEALGDILEV